MNRSLLLRTICSLAVIVCVKAFAFAQTDGKTTFNKTFARRAATVNGVKLSYLTGGKGEPLVLLHGFPETGYAWRKVMPALAEKYTLIVPDLRGLGDSEKTAAGYDKKTIAEDVYQLVQSLGHKQFYLVGHDFGGSTAYALAAARPEAVRKIVAIECVPAGLLTNEELADTAGKYFGGRAWFQGFHQIKDLPEQLIEGRERIYLKWLYDNFTVNKTANTPADYEVYFRAYSSPKAMHSALEYYRSLGTDAEHNREYLRTKLTMPILTIGGDGSLRDTTFLAFKKAANNVRGVELKDCGHFPAEEQSEQVTTQLLTFFGEPN